ncbi:MAG TPA: hypothetical protein VD766_05860 [Solirubrobacterales bacterium]|nr:hypothetical protein [Solirubrobacterales bacterium]
MDESDFDDPSELFEDESLEDDELSEDELSEEELELSAEPVFLPLRA